MVVLRKTDPDRDAVALHEVLGDPQSCLYLPRKAFDDVAETQAQLAAWVKAAPQTDWTIWETGDTAARGRVTIFETGEGVWEAGILICPRARKTGLARQAMALAIDQVDGLAQPRRIIADIDPDNVASVGLFERLGFQREGRLRAAWVTHIGVRDTLIYALIDSDPRPWRLTETTTD